MPEQITPLSVLYLLLHGAGTAVSAVLFLYLLLCRGKAIAPEITPPARLRRWAAALFGVMALAHIWWMLFYTFSDDTSSVIYGLLVAMDCMTLPPVFVGTLLNMLQDRRRPLWPIVVALIYGQVLTVAFIIYMMVAVRQYGRWLRDNYADLEHKEVWLSVALLISLMLLLTSYEYTDNYVMSTIAHLTGFPLAGLLLWRVETLKDLSIDNSTNETNHSPVLLRGEWGESAIGLLLAKHCEDTQLYLQPDLSLTQLSAAIGTNRTYLGSYFASQGTNYYAYIHDLRIRHFVARYRELAAERPRRAATTATAPSAPPSSSACTRASPPGCTKRH